MPACSTFSIPVTPDSNSSTKSFDPFQRKKIGSIRDNPKLYKIRQQFENASIENVKLKEISKNLKGFSTTDSAPSSFNYTSKSKTNGRSVVLEELFKIGSALKDGKEISNINVNSSHIRRHSEGGTPEGKSLSYLKDFQHDSHDPAVLRYINPKNSNSSSTERTSANECKKHGVPKLLNKDKPVLSKTKTAATYMTTSSGKTSHRKESPTSPTSNYNRLHFVSLTTSPTSPEPKGTLTKSSNSIDSISSCNASSESGVHTCSSTSEEDSPTSSSKSLSSGGLSPQFSRSLDIDDKPPPIPRRGLSLPVTNSILYQHVPLVQKTKSTPVLSPTRSPSSQSVIEEHSVRKAIQIYEGLSTKDFRSSKSAKKINNYPKCVPRKEQISSIVEHNGKRVTVIRRSSRRNSMRRSKVITGGKDDLKKINATSHKNTGDNVMVYKHSKEDSGIGFSDTDDPLKSPQGIYQTLCAVSLSRDEFDPYDRLSRIHDMVDRIHKGQSSTCAACKAIPSSIMQLSQAPGQYLLQVKCNELTPHHHPPCICFSCQHSTFSCSQSVGANKAIGDLSLDSLNLLDEQESLYYNVCCLNGISCGSWRQSRRRPVCEQNGRLCVVNCDMEKKTPSKDEEFYEKLSEWHSTPVEMRKDPPRVPHTTKPLSGDSCDSDEGWVDITDSEDEKVLLLTVCTQPVLLPKDCKNSSPCAKKSLYREDRQGNTVQNASYDIEKPDELYSKLGNESISRSTSSEHLYETIGDIEAQNNSNKENISYIGCDLQSKHETTQENDPDSGEWSTESSSPILGESSNHCPVEEKTSTVSETSAQTRFTRSSDLDCQDSGAKKTFIKSVLGKKAVNSKKRRMSNFFVPWLVSNHEYGTSSRSPKLSVKKQGSRTIKIDSNPTKASRTFTKSKRSQSIPSCVSGSDLSCTKAIFSSTEILDRCKSDTKELEQASSNYPESNFGLSVDSVLSLSPRGSLASSTYLRADQLQSVPVVKSRPSVSEDAALDVTVQRIFRRSTSGESDHSYILFQPIKEEDVPLYQFYERNIKERVALCRSPDSMSPVMWSSSAESSMSHECGHKTALMRPQLSVVEQLSPDAKDIKMLWCELPEVKDSGILERISAQELKLQEAAFEFIQSQASYIRSLKVLYEYFIQAPDFSDVQSSFCVLSKHEHDVLFSDIIGVKEVSERLMLELTVRWSDRILIPDICDLIYRHATMTSFSVYVKYCSNRVYQERTLKELKETRLCFLEVLRKLESNPACQGLSLESFLFLPMQHIARLPLLLDSIFRWLGPDSPSFNVCKMALEAVHKVFMECNDGAKKMERLEEMFVLNKQLEFKECKAIPLISASRWLLKKGELMKLEFDKKTFGRSSRCVRVPLYIFLFNDLIVITKRKSEDSYLVVDYCLREKVQAMAIDAKELQQPVVVPNTCRYLIYLTLFSNHQGSAVDMIINCTLLSERTRWLEAIHPVTQKKTSEVWEYDCPQVQCVRSYIAQQPDELSLQESDVVTINRKMNDGWYEGRRLRDGLQGWFPASYTMDIPCSRARASNLRQCYRLLMLSQKHEAKS